MAGAGGRAAWSVQTGGTNRRTLLALWMCGRHNACHEAKNEHGSKH